MPFNKHFIKDRIFLATTELSPTKAKNKSLFFFSEKEKKRHRKYHFLPRVFNEKNAAYILQ